MFRNGLLICLVFFSVSASQAAARLKNLKVFEDKFTMISADQAFQAYTQGKFVKAGSEGINYGFTRSAIWVYAEYEVFPDAAGKYFGIITYPHLDEVQIYNVTEMGSPLYVVGDTRKFANRILKTRHLHFPVELKAGKQALLLRVTSAGPVSFSLKMVTPAEFQKSDHEEQVILGIYYGVLLVMIAYNFFVFISLRSLTYLYYLLFIASFLFFQLALNGTGFEYVWSESVWWQNRSVAFFVGLFTFFGTLFTIRFLRTNILARWLHYTLSCVVLLSAVVSILSLIMPYHLSIRIATVTGTIFAICAIGAGTYGLVKNFRPARYFMLAWSFFILGGLALAMKNFGLMADSVLTNYGIQIGSAFEVILLSIALADRINTLRSEKDMAEKEAADARQRMLDSFRRFVPEEFIVRLGRENIEQVQQGDSAQTEISLLFHDIRNFTSLSETMSAHENFRFINSYLDKVGPVIENNKGFIDKFLGDAIMAIFPKGEGNALQAAADLRLTLASYNQKRHNFSYQAIETGSGVHAGQVMMGTVGSLNRLDTTVIGDVVNATSRIESITTLYKAGILVSGEALALLGLPHSAASRRLDRIQLRGKKNITEIFEIFIPEESQITELKMKTVNIFENGITEFRAGNFKDAFRLLREVLEENPADAAAKLFADRCAKLLEKNIETRHWSGVIKMK